MQDSTYTDMELKLRAECERGFSIGPKTPHTGPRPLPWIAPTGESFTEMTNPKRQAVAADDIAYDLAIATFREYAGGRSGTLYWRIYPEIERGKFYMMLLISDKPVLQPASIPE